MAIQIQPIAAGRLFQTYRTESSANFYGQEQIAIANVDSKRASVLTIQAKIQQTKSDTVKFGESQGDVSALQSQLEAARKEYQTSRADLAQVRATQRNAASDPQKNQLRPSITSNFLEKRVFARDFPSDAKTLKTYQYYNNRGAVQTFSTSSLQFVGTTIDKKV